MRLDYKILWFEDEKGWYEAILPDISDFLAEKGFELDPYRQVNDSDLETIIDEDKYDLILIDYNLLGGEKGDVVVEKIRDHKIYTDIVFYSQSGEKVVRDAAKEKGLDGVFCADRKRELFLDKVFKVIETTIKKVEDLNNMRGLVMASTSELDIKMERAIIEILKIFPPVDADNHKETIKSEFLESLNDRIKKITKIDPKSDIETLIKLIKEIGSYHKWRAMRRLCNSHKELKEFEPILSLYQKEIIDKRNILAHICEEIDESGKKILRSTLPGHEKYEFNETEAGEIRRQLKTYLENFNKILEKIQ
ncbi:MAG: hypothetical protein HUU32_17655 [Calditrichaceae bacterium]|nr:hypothetical protein [Calditrichia bacterium]NUQ43219.1 hypothetical protein [Calditrichaceae bacterium]